MKKETGLFYGWWIVAGGFILNFIGIGIGINAIGVFFKPVVESQGFSRGDFSLYFTIAAISMMLAAPVVGKLLEKYSVRLVMGISTAVLGVSFAFYSKCSTLMHFYLLSVIVGIGHGGSHLIPVSMMVNNWFVKKRGLAMGIVFTATGIGGLVFNPLANQLILHFGWRSTYMLLGIIMLIFCVPTSLFLMKRSPSDMGLNPDGIDKQEDSTDKTGEGLTLGEFTRTTSFWYLALMIFLINLLNMGIQQHLIPFLTDVGHSSTFAANIMALYLGMTVIGKPLLGQICDKQGLVKGIVLFTIILMAGMGFLFGAQFVVLAVIFAMVYGVGNAIQTILPPLMTAECAGIKHFAVIYGIMNIFSTLGAGIGMPLSGYIYDWAGSYNPAFSLYLIFAAAGMGLGVRAIKAGRTGGNRD